MIISIIQFIFGTGCIGSFFYIVIKHGHEISETKYWFLALVGNLFIAIVGLDLICRSGFFDLIGWR